MLAQSAMASEAIALAQREDEALERVVREHARLVYRIVYSVLRNSADAEDATQETFLRVLRYRKGLAGIADPKAWLAKIAWRVAVERRGQLLKANSRSEVPVEALTAVEGGAEHVLLVQERNALVEGLISALPNPLRDALILSTTQEVVPREVASMLGISEAAVRSRCFRAREILREKLLALNRART